MRGAFTLQRALANELAFPESNPGSLDVPRLVTARQVIEMATIAGAAANRLLDRVGTLTPGKKRTSSSSTLVTSTSGRCTTPPVPSSR